MATLADLAALGTLNGPDTPLRAAAYDSRTVRPGDLFCCVRGFTVDGHEHAPAAIERGAAALLVDHPLGLGVPELQVTDVRAAMAPAAAILAGRPTERLRVVGVTGTNGKTTTAYLVRHLLESAGEPAGLIGTVEQIVGGRRVPGGRTTPEAPDLQALFGGMLEAGDAACVMEVSSHALSLHRADAVTWAAVAFTNLSRDHLDFHGTLEEYFQAKRLLIAAAPDRAVIDLDDEHGARLAAEFPLALTVSIDDPRAALRAAELRFDPAGTDFALLVGDERIPTRVPLPGAFNVRNALTALGLARRLGLELAAAARWLPAAPAVPGRMEPIDRGQAFAVAVDYAHTPDALERVLQAARQLTERRVICVFGCGGDRDRGKRPEMGHAAQLGADVVVVTSDNPRSEDPAAIIRDVLEGIDQPVTVQPDRRAAIREAFELAEPGDFVVVAGKGHEQGQQVGPELLPFDDRVVAAELLEQLVAEGAR